MLLTLPPDCTLSAAELLARTSADPDIPLTFTLGDDCVAATDATPGEFGRMLRLSFAFHTAEEISAGVALLGQHIKTASTTAS